MTEEALRDILTERLGLASPRFEFERLPGGKLSGSVVSDTFKGLTDSDRQDRIWSALDEALGEQASSVVGTLLAYTDAEWDVDLAQR
jgi:acid stress-induced BolA-like protein IbaG/YrbA